MFAIGGGSLQSLCQNYMRPESETGPVDPAVLEVLVARTKAVLEHPATRTPKTIWWYVYLLDDLVEKDVSSGTTTHAQGQRHFASLLAALKLYGAELHACGQRLGEHLGISAVTNAAKIMRSLGQYKEAAELVREHLPMIEASSVIPPKTKATFFRDAYDWLFVEGINFLSPEIQDKAVAHARKSLVLALKAFGPGVPNDKNDQDVVLHDCPEVGGGRERRERKSEQN
jgi:hypothetical protein